MSQLEHVSMRPYPTSNFKFKQSDVMKREVFCPVCHSGDVVIEKGDGFRIIGPDFVAIHCNKCKLVYEFNDVIYKDERIDKGLKKE